MRLSSAGCLAALLLASPWAHADIRWVGGVSQDVFDEANWDLSNSAVTVIDPDVTIDDDVVFQGTTVPAVIPDLGGQVRLQIGTGRTLTLDDAELVAAGNDGIGGAPGAGPGPRIEVVGGGHLGVYFITNATHLDLDPTSTASFGGPSNPINGSTVDVTLGAVLACTGESPGDFVSEHLAKTTVDDQPAVVGGNLAVVSDGAAGCIVTAIEPGPSDSDDDLLTDADELTVYFTDPFEADSDADGTPDGLEVARGLDPLDSASRLERPNVIFVLCDDLGYGDLGVLFQNSVPGTKRHFTPHLDQMAAEGMILNRHYCPAAVCAPSRASLLTGVHQGHATVRNNQFDKALESNHNLATTLKRAGYSTALIGKWGLQGSGNSPATWPAYPTARGFEDFLGYVRHGDGHTHYPAHVTPARPMKELYAGDQEISAQLSRCYTADLFTARAKQYIVDQTWSNPDKPFFLLLAYDTPHAALHRPTQAYPAGSGLTGGLRWLGTPGNMINTASGTIDSFVHPDYAGLGWTEAEERFATAVRRLDDGVGDLIQTLRDLGIDEDTLIVFTSDNGPHEEAYTPGLSYDANAFDSFGPFDGIKRDAWEGGVRMPTLVRWPGTIAGGSIDDRPSQFHDWLATFTELGGWTTPARTDGVSLIPTLTGTGTQRDGIVYVEYFTSSSTPNYPEFDPGHRGRQRRQEQVIHLEGYKGIRVDVQSHATPFEIYDLAADPQEVNDLAGTSPFFDALEERMKARVLRVRRPNASAARPYDNELVPATTAAVVAGVDFASFVGLWPWLPELSLLTPVQSGITPAPDIVALPVATDAGVLFTGYLQVPASGDWTFRLTTDSGALLRVHEAQVIDDDFNHAGVGAIGSIRLQAGLHPFRLYYRTAHASPLLEWTWSGPGVSEQPVPASALVRDDRTAGTSYCPGNPNSSGLPGLLIAEGSTDIAQNDLRLVAAQLPAGEFGYCLASRTQGAMTPPGSVGVLCLGGSIARYNGSIGEGPSFSTPIDLSSVPLSPPVGVMPGETWNFQCWHRDGATSSFTGAVSVLFP
ncbi:MAG: sulfatase-like hydrolase/transferase [bacterium]|nr:sulfatase-like hydrolase/transferase [bacterium]